MQVYRKISCFVFALIILPLWAVSQSLPIRGGDKCFNDLNYANAIDYYERALAMVPGNAYVEKQLALSYMYTRNYPKSEAYFELLIKNPNHKSHDLLSYVQFLMLKGKYSDAQEQLEFFKRENPKDSLALALSKQLKRIEGEAFSQLYCKVWPIQVNSHYSDFAPVILDNTLIFTSARGSSNKNQRSYGWDGQHFLELFQWDSLSTDNKVTSFAKEIGTRFHEGTVCFAHNGETMFFTRSNFLKGKLRRSSLGVNNLKLFMASRGEEGWKIGGEFPYNSDEYSVGHPWVSADGKTLYFVSDMPGGFGGTDIYRCQWENNKFSEPENLGAKINTHGDEMFPYVSPHGDLFFASNGHHGMGGLDLFGINLRGANASLLHMGSPLNSVADDFSLIMDASGWRGYFASNRPGGVGEDDIYGFQIDEGNEVNVLVLGDSINNPVDIDALVLDRTPFLLSSIRQGMGSYRIKVKRGKTYQVHIEKEGYFAMDTILESGIMDPVKTLTYMLDSLPPIPMRELCINIHDNAKGISFVPEVLQIVEPEIIDLLNYRTEKGVSILLKSNQWYRLFGKKQGYYALDTTFFLATSNKQISHSFNLISLPEKEEEKEALPDELAKVYFDFDKAQVKTEAYSVIQNVVEILEKYDNMMVTLVARCDVRGSIDYNEKLSFKRAHATRRFFLEKGVDPKRVVVLALGESDPYDRIKGQSLEQWHQENRCVDFQLNTYEQPNTTARTLTHD